MCTINDKMNFHRESRVVDIIIHTYTHITHSLVCICTKTRLEAGQDNHQSLAKFSSRPSHLDIPSHGYNNWHWARPHPSVLLCWQLRSHTDTSFKVSLMFLCAAWSTPFKSPVEAWYDGVRFIEKLDLTEWRYKVWSVGIIVFFFWYTYL